MSIRFGITCGGDFWPREDIRAVEELGFDGFWTDEHIVYHRPISESTTLLTWQRFPPTPGESVPWWDSGATSTTRAAHRGDFEGMFPLGGNCC